MAISVELRTTCPKCGNPVPVNALVPEVHCPTCEHAFPFTADAWHQAFSAFAPVAVGDTDGGPLTLENGATLTRAASAPRCGDCDADLPVTSELLAGKPTLIRCACGASASVRELPRDLLPGAESYFTHLIGEDPAQLGIVSGAAPDAAEPVIFPCPHCGGSLPVDGTERVVKCSYCETSAYLPDDLWRRLHPVKTIERWYAWVDHEVIAHQNAEAAAASAAAAAEAAAAEKSNAGWSRAVLLLLAGGAGVWIGLEGGDVSRAFGAAGIACLLVGVQAFAVAIGDALRESGVRPILERNDAPGARGFWNSVSQTWAAGGMLALLLGMWAVAVISSYKVCTGFLPGAAFVGASGAVIVVVRVVGKFVVSRHLRGGAAPDRSALRPGAMLWFAVGALLAGAAEFAAIAASGATPPGDLVLAVGLPSLGLAVLLAYVEDAPVLRP